MRFTISLIALAVFLAAGFAKPERPGPPQERPQKPSVKRKIPALAGETNFGTLSQVGNNFTLKGHPGWEGFGEIRLDGNIVIAWTRLADGCLATGLYREMPDGSLEGAWGWVLQTDVENGKLTGQTSPERICRAKPPDPDLDVIFKEDCPCETNCNCRGSCPASCCAKAKPPSKAQTYQATGIGTQRIANSRSCCGILARLGRKR